MIQLTFIQDVQRDAHPLASVATADILGQLQPHLRVSITFEHCGKVVGGMVRVHAERCSRHWRNVLCEHHAIDRVIASL